jgi:hypothetical protein
MLWHKVQKILAWFVGLVAISIIALWLIDKYQQPQMVANILNIPSPPKSLSVLECESPITTDILTTCSIEISPNEFPLLLVGYKFEQIEINSTSHTLGVPKVGPEFPVNIEFTAEPVEFKHGGFVRVITDNEKKHAIIDLYIE